MTGRAAVSRDEVDESIPADDGTRWVYSPELNVWNGWTPGEPGLWEMNLRQMMQFYPEVVEGRRKQRGQ